MNSLFIELRRYGGLWRWRIIKKPKVGNKRVMAAGEDREFDVAVKEALDAYDVVKGAPL